MCASSRSFRISRGEYFVGCTLSSMTNSRTELRPHDYLRLTDTRFREQSWSLEQLPARQIRRLCCWLATHGGLRKTEGPKPRLNYGPSPCRLPTEVHLLCLLLEVGKPLAPVELHCAYLEVALETCHKIQSGARRRSTSGAVRERRALGVKSPASGRRAMATLRHT